MASTHTIMSTTSSWKPHHQVVGKWKSLEACKFEGESTLGRETLCFYRYGGSWVAYRLCVSPGPRSAAVKKHARLQQELDLHFKMFKNCHFTNCFLRVIPALTHYPDILSGIWKSFWHLFWHSIWHLLWHSFWQMFWHSVWQSFLHLF